MNLVSLVVCVYVAFSGVAALVFLRDWRARLAVLAVALLVAVGVLEAWGLLRPPTEFRPATARRYSEPEPGRTPPPPALAPARPDYDAGLAEYLRRLESVGR